jgi:hypothetical protein
MPEAPQSDPAMAGRSWLGRYGFYVVAIGFGAVLGGLPAGSLSDALIGILLVLWIPAAIVFVNAQGGPVPGRWGRVDPRTIPPMLCMFATFYAVGHLVHH